MVLQEAEEAKVREIEETKQRKRQEILEKRKLEREKEELKKSLELRFKKNCQIADDFYRKFVLRRGFNLFKQMVGRTEKITEIIQNRQNTSLLRNILQNWHSFSQYSKNRDRIAVENFRHNHLKKSFFTQWTRILTIEAHNNELADNFQNQKLLQKTFIAWNEKALETKLAEWRNIKIADEFSNERICRKALKSFKVQIS